MRQATAHLAAQPQVVAPSALGAGASDHSLDPALPNTPCAPNPAPRRPASPCLSLQRPLRGFLLYLHQRPSQRPSPSPMSVSTRHQGPSNLSLDTLGPWPQLSPPPPGSAHQDVIRSKRGQRPEGLWAQGAPILQTGDGKCIVQSNLGASGTAPEDGQLNGLSFFQICESPWSTHSPGATKHFRALTEWRRGRSLEPAP